MNTLNEYYAEFVGEVAARAEAENDYMRSAFVGAVGDILVDAMEIGGIEACYFDGVGARGRRIGVDAYFADDPDGSVVLIRAAYSGSNVLGGTSVVDVRKAISELEGFAEECLSGRFSAAHEESSDAYQLGELLRMRGGTITRLVLLVIADGEVRRSIDLPATATIGSVRSEFSIWDIARVHDVASAASARLDLSIDLERWVPGGLDAIEAAGTNAAVRTFLTAVPGDIIADLYELYGSRLLESNVRSYLSARGKVNKGIQQTAMSEPDLFLALNNGITATATNVLVSNVAGRTRMRRISDLQIVNGGQTTASLFYARRDRKGVDLSDVAVQMKLVIVDSARSDEMVPKISRSANSQNRVSDVDFFANSPVHQRLEVHSRRVLVPAREGDIVQTRWFYERARGQWANERSRLTGVERRKFERRFPRSQVISKSDAAKYFMCFEMAPNVVSLGAQKNFVEFAAMMSKRWERNSDSFDELFFKELVAKAMLYNEVRRGISHAEWYTPGYLANIVAYSIGKFVFEVGQLPGRKNVDLGAIWDSQGVHQSILDEIVKIGLVVRSLLTKSNRPVQNVTEWAKKAELWSEVQAVKHVLSDEVRALLVSADVRAEQKKSAAKLQSMDRGIDAQVRALSVPASKWREVRLHALNKGVALTEKDVRALRVVCDSAKMPTEFQSELLVGILDRVAAMGFEIGT
ncbi:hypothetical protein MTP03_17500 [Tsukamurella sp. PLM1]|nr:hypothetical protein MTP03_17500 [Tsukamurella sp. PLM1]